MPLWFIVTLGGGAALWLYSRAKAGAASAAAALAAGVPKYTLATSTPFYSHDPSADGSSGIPDGALAQGSAVSATAAQPVLSSDTSYELVFAPNGQSVWVSVAALQQA